MPDMIARYGGRLTGGPVVDAWEGEARPNMVAVITFDSVGDARRLYDSDEYQAICGLRQASGRTAVHVVDVAAPPLAREHAGPSEHVNPGRPE